MLSISYSYFSSGRKNNKFRVYFPFYFIHHRAGRERGRDFALKFLGQNILRRREQEIGERRENSIRGRREREQGSEEERKGERRKEEEEKRVIRRDGEKRVIGEKEREREKRRKREQRERGGGRMSRNRRQGKTRVI
jgi:hypothetical protein